MGNQVDVNELLKKAKKLGYPVHDFVYLHKECKLIIIGERRNFVAYDNGQWFSVAEAKVNATKNEGKP